MMTAPSIRQLAFPRYEPVRKPQADPSTQARTVGVEDRQRPVHGSDFIAAGTARKKLHQGPVSSSQLTASMTTSYLCIGLGLVVLQIDIELSQKMLEVERFRQVVARARVAESLDLLVRSVG
jgi:hypothetical protein